LSTAESLQKSCPNANVERIQIIQNIDHWTAYKHECERIKKKLDKPPVNKYLWHGTRATDPMEIFQSETGFDVRFSKDQGNMYGRAVYFAE
jgi:hypothetical protein